MFKNHDWNKKGNFEIKLPCGKYYQGEEKKVRKLVVLHKKVCLDICKNAKSQYIEPDIFNLNK